MSLEIELESREVRTAEVLWYEAHGVGKKKMKIKRLIDQERRFAIQWSVVQPPGRVRKFDPHVNIGRTAGIQGP